MHKIFGEKHDIAYYDRRGAYIIPFQNDRFGVVQTPKGYFFIGGGIEKCETDCECIQRECLEETGYTALVGNFLCSAEAYVEHPIVKFFHPIQAYYTGELIQQVQAPIETDHKLVWMTYEQLKGNMFSEMQNWALDLRYNEKRRKRDSFRCLSFSCKQENHEGYQEPQANNKGQSDQQRRFQSTQNVIPALFRGDLLILVYAAALITTSRLSPPILRDPAT